MKNNIELSIIIVHYKVAKELFACISSIFESKPKVRFEIIVVDNDEEPKIGGGLKDNFSEVKYIESGENIGFGAGNNLGAKAASGKYLFFLNPDTVVKKNVFDELVKFIKKNPDSGMIAPLLLDPSGNSYSNQGSSEYNLANAIITSSFVNKFFPNNPISRDFFHKNWTKKETEEFDVVPGTAFMIRKSLFEEVGMFDENFFLYFEEYDLAKRIKELGFKNYIVPKARIFHVWEASTKTRKDIDSIFSQSRNYFFKKNYGGFCASIINIVSSIGKYEVMLGFVLAVSAFLGLFRIRELMPFIGDQGWFYLSAKDMLISGQIPLVGIASSHPWLHQGPFWTYLLVPFLWLFNFDPVSGAYLTTILGVLSVAAIYVVGSTLFSRRVGLIASLLYATSPLAVYYIRFPYHTSPIPLFVIIFTLFLYKVIQGKFNYLPLAIFILVILYNFEIATVALWGVLAVVLTYKIIKNKEDLRKIFNKKNIILSFLSLVVPLLPMILYDVGNGFPQTLKFAAWIFYRVISLFGYNPQQAFSINKISVMFDFLFVNFTRLIFAQSNLIALTIFVSLIAWICYILFRKEKPISYIFIFLFIFIPFVIIVFNQTPSDAYLPIIFPAVILIFALFLDFIMSFRRTFAPVFAFLIILAVGNMNFMFDNNFMFDRSGRLFTLDRRLQAAQQVLNIVKNKDYNLKAIGPGSEFKSFTMNYKYLLWWLGHSPSEKSENLKVYISESANGIKIKNKTDD